VIPRFISAFLEDEPPVVFGDGEQSRDFTYVDNAVDATLRAAEADGVVGQVFNVACGERITLNALLGELERLTGKQVEPHHAEARPGDLRDSLADISRAREALGYHPAVDVRDGLERALHFYEQRRAGGAAETASA
jgi:nucleoside-diphosphate-sugar epimerase